MPATIISRDGKITAVKEGQEDTGKSLPGLVIPGLANAHSHAFHRALRARTEVGAATFWDWRTLMYRVASNLDPDSYLRLARAVYAEMALAGITAVGEFHYVHHAPGGDPYDDPNAMGESLIEAAGQAGIRITLLDACYLSGGFDEPLNEHQARFGDRDVSSWAERVSEIAPGPHLEVGAAIHSVRALPEESMDGVVAWAEQRESPLHFHLSEQQAENDACLAATGRTPTQLLHDRKALGPRSTAVHATHLTARDIELLGETNTCACLCPTTERSLADGVGPVSELRAAGCAISAGSDSHAVIDLFEEARAMELDERLVTGRRGENRAGDLFASITMDGMTSLGWDGGEIAAGKECDLVALDLSAPRFAGYQDVDASSWIVFVATPGDITHVVVSGRLVVEDGQHLLMERPEHELASAIREVMP